LVLRIRYRMVSLMRGRCLIAYNKFWSGGGKENGLKKNASEARQLEVEGVEPK
jgi:hypothetical protein